MAPLLLLLLAAATATATTDPPPLSPTPWPDRFHAVLFTNLTNISTASTGPPLQLADLYYDWPRRRNLNLVRHQLSRDPLYDVEWNNGTTFYFDSASCRVEHFPVGVLPPWWLSGGGAEYVGRRVAGGFDCHVWSKAGFVHYYEEVATGRPVRWDFFDEISDFETNKGIQLIGIQQVVMSYEVGVALEDDEQWQAPAHCFPEDADEENRADRPRLEKTVDKKEVAVGLEAARLLKKLAGAATAF